MSATGKVLKASFTGGAEYKQIREGSSNHSEIYTLTKAECRVYRGSLNAFGLPNFSDSFKTAVSR